MRIIANLVTKHLPVPYKMQNFTSEFGKKDILKKHINKRIKELEADLSKIRSSKPAEEFIDTTMTKRSLKDRASDFVRDNKGKLGIGLGATGVGTGAIVYHKKKNKVQANFMRRFVSKKPNHLSDLLKPSSHSDIDNFNRANDAFDARMQVNMAKHAAEQAARRAESDKNIRKQLMYAGIGAAVGTGLAYKQHRDRNEVQANFLTKEAKNIYGDIRNLAGLPKFTRAKTVDHLNNLHHDEVAKLLNHNKSDVGTTHKAYMQAKKDREDSLSALKSLGKLSGKAGVGSAGIIGGNYAYKKHKERA